MDLKDLQNLIKFISKSGVSQVKYRTKDFEIDIKADSYREEASSIHNIYQPPVAVNPVVAPQLSIPAASENIVASESANEDKYITIKSPMIGTFYRRPSPDKEAFVNVGTEVSPDTVVCIIEAMKLFNQIESDISGKIVKILVDDATPVEYDQPLFLVEPI